MFYLFIYFKKRENEEEENKYRESQAIQFSIPDHGQDPSTVGLPSVSCKGLLRIAAMKRGQTPMQFIKVSKVSLNHEG